MEDSDCGPAEYENDLMLLQNDRNHVRGHHMYVQVVDKKERKKKFYFLIYFFLFFFIILMKGLCKILYSFFSGGRHKQTKRTPTNFGCCLSHYADR